MAGLGIVLLLIGGSGLVGLIVYVSNRFASRERARTETLETTPADEQALRSCPERHGFKDISLRRVHFTTQNDPNSYGDRRGMGVTNIRGYEVTATSIYGATETRLYGVNPISDFEAADSTDARVIKWASGRWIPVDR